jgi:anti-repressor protein
MYNITKAFAYGKLFMNVYTDENGNPWFMASEVCDILCIKNHNDAVSRLDADEKDGIGITDSIGRAQQSVVISESGLYSLIMRSRLQSAKLFKKWVTSEVLPSIRKTGSYNKTPSIYDYARALLEAESRLEEAQPAIAYLNRVEEIKKNYSFDEIGKHLGIGRNKLFEWLRSLGILKKKNGANIPYYDYLSWFELTYIESNGKRYPCHWITEKGKKGIIKLYYKGK